MNGWVLVAGDFAIHGGMDRANLELARFLAMESPVHLVTHHASDEIAKLPNITVHRVPRPFGMHLAGQPLLARAGRKWAAHFAQQGYRVVVNGGNCNWPDVNWVHCVHAAYPAPATGNRLRRAKTVAVHRLNRWSERRAIRAARTVICNSHRTARDVVEFLGVERERVHTVYLGSDTTRLSLISPQLRSQARSKLGWDERPWVGFVGQLGNQVKGFDTLYSAWRDLCRDAEWNANLAVVGEGPDRTFWERRAAHDGLQSRVRFLGFRTDVPEVLAACDVLAAPSRYDAYGLAANEALCRGLPVVVSKAAGISERYPPSLSELILDDPANPNELAHRLRNWRANRATFSEQTRAFADDLRGQSWTDMARAIRDLVLRT